MKKHKNSIVSICLVLFMLFGTFGENYNLGAATIPKSTATPTTSNLETLFSKYNEDVYTILKNEKSSADSWCLMLGSPLALNIDTIVHETYHEYTFDMGRKSSWDAEAIYAGNGKFYYLKNYADFFPTYKSTKSIPGTLRTFRYNTYVSETANASSNTYGMYGLLNEFSAYYWGLNAMVSLKDCYGTDDTFMAGYVSSLGNNMTAYAEFKYWMLTYMIYAKKNYPALYKKLINDKAYCEAYADIEQKFAKLIKTEINNLSKTSKKITLIERGIYYNNSGVALADYNKLIKELKKSKYVNMDNAIKNKVRKKQAITTRVSSKSYKAAALKKKAKSFKIGAAAKTSVSYESNAPKYVTVSEKGKVTVKKKTPKGTYTVTVTAEADNTYIEAVKKIKINVK